ncbi:DUF4932 domain-containing protein [Chryseobacterium sp. POE27]|uniref:DUF4932 domain-containing protein n=1 Tax=Chryseobacterium sp. POE27 TaxID=3138177 RepID=UPI00321B68DE
MKKILILFLMIHIYSFGQKNITVKIDHRIEAVSIFYTLATMDTLDTKPTPSIYYKQFSQYFADCKNHKSLDWYRNLKVWDGYDLSSIGLYLSDKYPFKLKIPYSSSQLRSSEINIFLEKFNAFYKDCKVDAFLKAHKADYAEIVKYTKDKIIASNLLVDAEKYYNKPTKGEIIIFVDILNNLGSNAISIQDKSFRGKKIFKLAYLKDNNIVQTNDSKVTFIPLPNVVIHEVSHLYLRDFIPLYRQRLIKKKNIFLVTAKGEKLKEAEWENELDELIVRVCVSKIMGEKYGPATEMKEVQNQSIHFKYFKELNSFFNNYTQHKSKYKSILDFYPELINYLETLN